MWRLVFEFVLVYVLGGSSVQTCEYVKRKNKKQVRPVTACLLLAYQYFTIISSKHGSDVAMKTMIASITAFSFGSSAGDRLK